MTVDDKIKDEKLQYGIDREVAKIHASSSEKIDRYEYLIGEGQQSKLNLCVLLQENLQKNKQNINIKKIQDKKQIKSIEDHEQ